MTKIVELVYPSTKSGQQLIELVLSAYHCFANQNRTLNYLQLKLLIMCLYSYQVEIIHNKSL